MSVSSVGTAIATLGVNTRAWFAGLSAAQKQWTSFAAQMQVSAYRIGTVWAATVGVVMGASVKMGMSFEKEFTGVRKTIDATEKQFAHLKETLITTAKATGMSADTLAVLARKGGQLGVAAGDLDKFTTTIAKLSIAAVELDPEEAANGLARLINITGASMKDIDVFASVLAKLGDSFATNESRILNFSERIAGLAKVTGMTADDALSLGAAFTATVPGVELVATQLSKGMGIFAKSLGEGGDRLRSLDGLVKDTGKTFTEVWKEDAATAIAHVLEGLGKLKQSDAFDKLAELGLTNQRAAQAFLAAAGSADKFYEALSITKKEIEEVAKGGGKLEKVFKEQMETIGAKWGQVWEGMREVAIRLFDAYADEIKQFLDLTMKALDIVADWAEAFGKLPSFVKIAVAAILTFPAALAAVKWGLGALIYMFVDVGTSMGGFAKLFSKSGGMAQQMDLFGKNATKASGGLGKLAIQGLALAAAFKLGWEFGKLLMDKFPGLKKWAESTAKSFSEWIGILDDAAEQQKKLAKTTGEASKQMIDAILRNMRFTGEAYTKAELYRKSHEELAGILDKQNQKLQELETGVKQSGTAFEEAGDDIDEFGKKAKEAREYFKGLLSEFAKEMFPEKSIAQSIKDYFGSKESIDAMRTEMNNWASVTLKDFSGEGNIFMPGYTPMGAKGQGARSDLPNFTAEIAALANETEPVTDEFQKWGKFLADAQRLMRAFGIESQSTLGTIISGSAMLVGVLKQFEQGGGFSYGNSMLGKGDYLGAAGAGMSGAAAVWGATGSGSRAKRVSGGALAGASAGAQIGGPWGAAIGGAAGAIAGLFRGGKVLKAMKDLAKQFGSEVSEELAKAIVESSKELGSMQNAIAANLGDILTETGVDAANIGEATQAFSNLVGMVENGTLDMKDAADQLGTSFNLIVEYFGTMGTEGALAIGEIVRQMLAAGVVTDELKQHLESMLSEVQAAMAPALEWIAGLEDMTAEEAQALSGVVVAAWGTAIAQTGSFILAVQQLGETFTNALAAISEALGPEGSNIINPIAEIVNVINNSEGALPALAAIASGLDAMAQSGILTAGALASMGDAIQAAFNRAVEATGNETAALKAAWPELVKLYDYYEKMGLDVPPWLQELIDKGKEMGLSMQMPLGTNEALNAILEVLLQIAKALGAVATEAGKAADSVGSIPPPPGPGDYGGGGGRHAGAQVGWQGDVLSPMTMTVAESGPERVEITPQGAGAGGGGMGTIILQLDGVELGRIISEGSKTGKVRIVPTAVREF